MNRSIGLAVALLLILSGCAPTSRGRVAAPPVVADSDPRPRVGSDKGGAETAAEPREKPRATVLSYRVAITVAEDGSYTRKLERRYRIDDRAALEQSWAETAAYWSPWRESRPTLEVSVVSHDGTTHTLDPATIQEVVPNHDDPTMYSDRRGVRAPIPNLDEGAVVTEIITSHTTQPLAPNASGGVEAVGDWFGAEAAEVAIDVPLSLPLRWKMLGEPLTPTDSRDASRRRLVYKRGSFTAPAKSYESVPDDVWRAAYVVWGTGSDWRALASHYRALLGRVEETADLRHLAQSLVAKGDDTLTRARKLTAYVHEHVRYVGLEFGESAIVPHTSAETLSRTYGDCKDQASLLVTLLRAADVPAEVALVATGHSAIAAEVPMLDAFDHAIVYVPGASPLWIDPTDTQAGPGVLSANVQGKFALITGAGADGLTRIPESSAAKNTYDETREVYLATEGTARIVETTRSTGLMERALRGSYSGPAARARENATKYIDETYAAKKLGEFKVSKSDDLAHPFEITYEALDSRRGFSNDELSEFIVEDGVLTSTLRGELFADESRPFGVQLGFAERRTLEVIAHSEKAFEADGVPENETIRLGPATLTRKFERRSPHELRARITLEMPSRSFTADEVKATRVAVADYVKRPAVRLQFPNRASRFELGGQTEEALATLRANASEKSASVVEGRRLVSFLLRMGFVGEARREAESVVRRFPDSAAALSLQASTLVHDSLGRATSNDVDYRGALPLLEKAYAKDHSDGIARRFLAAAVRIDPLNRLSFEPSRIDRAVALLTEGPAGEGDEKRETSSAFLFLRGGRLSEARAHAAKAEEEGARALDELVLAAAENGAAGVVHALAAVQGDDAKRLQLLDRSASLAFIARAYSAAVILREEYARREAKGGGAGGSNDAQLQLMRALRDGLASPSPLVGRMAGLLGDLAVYAATGRRLDGGRAVTGAEKALIPTIHTVFGDLSKVSDTTGIEPVRELVQAGIRAEKVRDVGALVEMRLRSFPEKTVLETVLVSPTDAKAPILLSAGLDEWEAGEIVRERLAHDGESAARALLDWYFSLREPRGGIPTATPGIVAWQTTHDVALALAAMNPSKDSGNAAILEKGRAKSDDRAFQIAIDSAIAGVGWRHAVPEAGAALERLANAGAPEAALRNTRLRWLAASGKRPEMEAILGNPETPPASRASAFYAAAEGFAARGQLAEAVELYERANRLEPLTGRHANQALWFGVLAGKESAPWLKDVAVSFGATKDSGQLHTLACYQVAVGDTREAIKTIGKYVEAYGAASATPVALLPLALLAERHGLTRAAIELLEPLAADHEVANNQRFAEARIAKLRKSAAAGK